MATVRSKTTSTVGVDGTSHAATLPATISSGDLILVVASFDDQPTITWPSGWKRIGWVWQTFVTLVAIAKIADGTEGGTTVTFTTNESEQSAHLSWAIQDWAGDLKYIAFSAYNVASTSAPQPPALTTGWGSQNFLAIAGWGCNGGATNTSVYSTGYADGQEADSGASNATVIAAATKAVTGATGDSPDAGTIGATGSVIPFTIGIADTGVSTTFPYVASTATSVAAANTTAPTVSLPPSVDSGDLLIAICAFDGAPSITWDNSTHGTWTEIKTLTNGTAHKSTVYAKVADGTEDAGTLTLTTGSEQMAAVSYAIKGWYGTLATGLEASTGATGTSASVDADSLNPTNWDVENTLWMIAGGTDSGTCYTLGSPTGFLSPFAFRCGSAAGNCSVFSAFIHESAASKDPAAFDVATSDDWTAVTLGIRPAAAAPSDYSAAASTGIQNWLGFQADQIGIHRHIQPGIAYLNAEGFAPSVDAGTYIEASTGYANFSGFSAQAIYDSIATAGRINFNTGTHQTHVTREFFGLLGQLRALGFLVDQTNSQGFFPNIGSIVFQGQTGATVTVFTAPTTFTAAALLRETHFVGFQAQTIRDFFPIAAGTHALGFTPQYVEFINEITGPDQGQVNFSGFQAQAVILGQINDAIGQKGEVNLVGFQHAVDMWRTLDILQGRINMQGFAAGVALFQGGTINLSGITGEVNFDTLQQAIGMYRTFYPDSGLTNAEGYVPVPSTGTLVQSIVGILNQEGFIPFIVAERYRGIVGEMRLEGFAPTIGGGLWTPKRRRATSWAAIN